MLKSDYNAKFAAFIEGVKASDAEAVIVAYPEVLGDNYQEIVESLRRIAAAGKYLVIGSDRQFSDT